MKYPNLLEEKKLWKKGYKWVAGLDEAGRGPLAGPVVAAAVMIKNKKLKIKNKKYKLKIKKPNNATIEQFGNLGIQDSKRLTALQREKLYRILTNSNLIKWGIGRVSEKVIDRINIKNAAELAMEKAIRKLKIKPDFLIIDGNRIANLNLKSYNFKLIVKADARVFSCCVASIIAKVTRDRIMKRYHKKYPQYGFAQHKGYPTRYHIKMLKKFGPSAIHRLTYKPVKDIIKKDET